MANAELLILPRTKPRRASALRSFATSYVGVALVSPAHALALTALVLGSLAAGSAVPLLAGLPFAESLVVVALPRLPWFRARIDRQRAQAERDERERRRKALVASLSESHRDAFYEMQERVEAIASRPLPVFQPDSLERLLDLYVAVAAVHDDARRAMKAVQGHGQGEDGLTSKTAADACARADEEADASSPTERTRLESARRARRSENEARLRTLAEQLLTIAAAIDLLYERTLIAANPAATAAALSALIEEIEDGAPLVEALFDISGASLTDP